MSPLKKAAFSTPSSTDTKGVFLKKVKRSVFNKQSAHRHGRKEQLNFEPSYFEERWSILEFCSSSPKVQSWDAAALQPSPRTHGIQLPVMIWFLDQNKAGQFQKKKPQSLEKSYCLSQQKEAS